MKNKDLLLVSSVICVLYLLLLGLLLGFAVSNSNILSQIISTTILIPHILLTAAALIFSIVGWAKSARWGAMTAGILYILSIAWLLFSLSILAFLAIPFMLIILITMTLCFAAYALMPRDAEGDTSNIAMIVAACSIFAFVIGGGFMAYKLCTGANLAENSASAFKPLSGNEDHDSGKENGLLDKVMEKALKAEFEKALKTEVLPQENNYTENNSGGDDGENPELSDGSVYESELYLRMAAAIDKENTIQDTSESTVDLIDGYTELYDAWEKELNIVYKKLMALLPADRKKQLKKEELKWIKSKEKNAEAAAAEYEGGTLAGVVFIRSKFEDSKKRTIELAKMYDNYTNHSLKPDTAEGGVKCMINGENVNMREYPDVKADVVYKFTGYETVYADGKIEAQRGKYPWYKVTYGGYTGWVYGQFIKK